MLKNLFNLKTEYCLMHKDVRVLTGEYSLEKHGFTKITSIDNHAHLPIGTLKDNALSLSRLNAWFVWRGIPKYRLGLLQLQSRLGIDDPRDLLEKEYALSISDTYWIKEKDDPVSYEKINFFDRDFDDFEFGKAMFAYYSPKAHSSARHTPNNVTCGYQKKAWFKRKNKLYLLKGGTPIVQMEPINEWLAAQIAKRLNLFAIPYKTEIYEENLVSVCRSFTDKNIDLVTAKSILTQYNAPKNTFQYPFYVELLKKHGVQEVERCLSDQMVLDYLLLNTDRHTQNMGVLIDANTNEWHCLAPVFDTGTGLGCLVNDDEVLLQEDKNKCELFNAKRFSHEQLVNFMLLNQYDFTTLNDLPRLFGEQLVKYQSLTNISNKRIEDTYTLFYKQLLKLKKYAK